MVWIEPLSLREWFVNVLSGDLTYFVPIAIFCIISMAAYFRMTGLTMGFMIFVFLLMFSGIVPGTLFIFVAIIGGLLVGWAVSRIMR